MRLAKGGLCSFLLPVPQAVVPTAVPLWLRPSDIIQAWLWPPQGGESLKNGAHWEAVLMPSHTSAGTPRISADSLWGMLVLSSDLPATLGVRPFFGVGYYMVLESGRLQGLGLPSSENESSRRMFNLVTLTHSLKVAPRISPSSLLVD